MVARAGNENDMEIKSERIRQAGVQFFPKKLKIVSLSEVGSHEISQKIKWRSKNKESLKDH